jgi:hypothetical protein
MGNGGIAPPSEMDEGEWPDTPPGLLVPRKTVHDTHLAVGWKSFRASGRFGVPKIFLPLPLIKLRRFSSPSLALVIIPTELSALPLNISLKGKAIPLQARTGP